MSTTSEPNFDWNQAASLLGDDPQKVDPDMVEIVLELVASADSHFQELKKKNAETERKDIGAQAHQLRGSLLNFGFIDVGEVLLFIEKGDYPPSDYPALIEKAETVFVASKYLLVKRYPTIKLP